MYQLLDNPLPGASFGAKAGECAIMHRPPQKSAPQPLSKRGVEGIKTDFDEWIDFSFRPFPALSPHFQQSAETKTKIPEGLQRGIHRFGGTGPTRRFLRQRRNIPKGFHEANKNDHKTRDFPNFHR